MVGQNESVPALPSHAMWRQKNIANNIMFFVLVKNTHHNKSRPAIWGDCGRNNEINPRDIFMSLIFMIDVTLTYYLVRDLQSTHLMHKVSKSDQNVINKNMIRTRGDLRVKLRVNRPRQHLYRNDISQFVWITTLALLNSVWMGDFINPFMTAWCFKAVCTFAGIMHERSPRVCLASGVDTLLKGRPDAPMQSWRDTCRWYFGASS